MASKGVLGTHLQTEGGVCAIELCSRNFCVQIHVIRHFAADAGFASDAPLSSAGAGNECRTELSVERTVFNAHVEVEDAAQAGSTAEALVVLRVDVDLGFSLCSRGNSNAQSSAGEKSRCGFDHGIK